MAEIEKLLSKYQLLQIADIKPARHQARKRFDEEGIKTLAESIKAEGLIQPISVRLVGDGYEMIYGERRLRACKLLGMTTIEAKVIQTVSEAEAAAKGLIENLQRADLDPIEEAEGFQEMLNLNDAHWTQEKIAEVTGRSPDYVSRSLALLKLPSDIIEKLRQRNLTREHGIELMRLNNANSQKGMANKILKGGWSVKQTRQAIDRKLAGKAGKKAPAGDATKADTAIFWRKFLNNPAVPAIWKVNDSDQEWTFKVTKTSDDALPQLAEWFTQMGAALKDELSGQGSPDILSGTTRVISQGHMRIPKTPEEIADYESQGRQSPAKAYGWIWGADSPMAKALGHQSWKEAGYDDALEGCRTLLDGMRRSAEGKDS